MGFTGKLDPGFENVVQVNDADGFCAALFKDEQRSDRTRQVSFHLRQRLGSQEYLFRSFVASRS